MARQILFIQGGGEDGYEADKVLVQSLEKNLGEEYEINYPRLQTDESVPDFGWIQEIEQNVLEMEVDLIVVGHSLGASMLLKYVSEKSITRKIKAMFLVSTPFWSGEEDWKAGLKLKENFADILPGEVPLFFYHCKDDDVAPFSQLAYYKQKVTWGIFREIESGGHQLDNDLSFVARDIKSLSNVNKPGRMNP